MADQRARAARAESKRTPRKRRSSHGGSFDQTLWTVSKPLPRMTVSEPAPVMATFILSMNPPFRALILSGRIPR